MSNVKEDELRDKVSIILRSMYDCGMNADLIKRVAEILDVNDKDIIQKLERNQFF